MYSSRPPLVANKPYFQNCIDLDVTSDQENLFSLADAVLEAAPRRKWAAWVIDACDGYYVAQFLDEACRLDGASPPPQVHIANSRDVRDLPRHQRVVFDRLADPDLHVKDNNVLIITEYVSEGVCLDRLTRPLRRLKAAGVDAAILSLDYPYSNPYDRKNPPDELYFGKPRTYEPKLMYGTVQESLGQESVANCAEPQDEYGFDPSLREYATTVFRDLAHQYTAAREPLAA